MEVDDNGNEMISVEVAYATPEKQLIIALTVPLGTTAYDAVKLSAISEEFSEINIEKDEMGIFSKPLDGKGRPKPNEYKLCAGDRVEVYGPLIIDPKSARLNRAQAAKSSKSTRTSQKKK